MRVKSLRGGGYGLVRAVNIGGEVNHIPAFGSYKNTSLSLSHYKGPSIFMDKLDHQLTASWGSKKSAFQWRTMQEHLIQRGKFGKAMEMDIRTFKGNLGTNIMMR